MSYAYDLEYIRRDRELESTRILGMCSEQLVTGPVEEPVTVDEVKRHLRISGDDENELIDRYIRAARRMLENDLRRAFLPQTWDVGHDEPPYYSAPMLLPRAPVASVTSITSYDTLNVPTVYSSSKYVVDSVSEPGRIALNWGEIWPAPATGLRNANALIVRYVCGYAAPELVPDDLTTALMLMVGTLYENRESTQAMRASMAPNETMVIPAYIDALIAPYRLVRI